MASKLKLACPMSSDRKITSKAEASFICLDSKGFCWCASSQMREDYTNILHARVHALCDGFFLS